jgi:hypothetical protein
MERNTNSICSRVPDGQIADHFGDREARAEQSLPMVKAGYKEFG